MKPNRVFSALSFAIVLSLAPCRIPAEGLNHLHDFSRAEGAGAYSLLLAGDTVYGTAFNGGLSNGGTIFKLPTDASDFAVLRHFTASEGNPSQRLLLSGNALFGVTYSGGSSNLGTVFKLGLDDGSYSVLKHFTGADGASPGGPLSLSGTTLFGTTISGGQSNSGTVFRLETDGSGFSVIKSFTGTSPGDPVEGDGAGPRGDLAISGDKLYGATLTGGPGGHGVVFTVNKDGSGYRVIRSGDSTQGWHFTTGVLLSGSTLYGTALDGGGMMYLVFSLNADTTEYRVLWRSGGFEGVNPSGLVLAEPLLYASGSQGGAFNAGVVVAVRTDGGNSVPLKFFDGIEGWGPGGLQVSGSTLYGTTVSGGKDNDGLVFAMPLGSAISTPPRTQTAETGADVRFSVSAQGFGKLNYAWNFNNSVPVGTNGPCLLLTNIQPQQAGTYTVVITNILSSITSSPAMLGVVPRVERRTVPCVVLKGTRGISGELQGADCMNPSPQWTAIENFTLTDLDHYYFDLTDPVPAARFFRAQQSGPPALALLANLVPALTLAGSPNSQVRVEAINQFGPVDAWFALATVALTNTSQLYFDVTAPGQPPRCYRLVPVP